MAESATKRWSDIAFLSYGFRPFFLLAAIQAILSVGIWVPWFLGLAAPRTDLPPVAWHANSLLFGYVWAAIAGFLLTAVPNWTGRRPITGRPLAALVALYVFSRISTLGGVGLPPLVRGVADLAFGATVIGVVAREIIAARNWRNVKVIVALTVLAIAHVWFHYEVERFGVADISQRLAIATIIMLIGLIGGRIIPAFTTNWLKARGVQHMPAPFATFDAIVMAAGAAAFALWVVAAHVALPKTTTGVLLMLAGLLHLVRQSRWQPQRTLAEPLLAILHVAYVFVGLGFLLTGLGELPGGYVSRSAGLHAWTSGAVATMTLAVMTRASLGHTGRPLTCDRLTALVYALIVAAALLRIGAALSPVHTLALMPLAGLAWVLAYGLFLVGYGSLFIRQRASA